MMQIVPGSQKELPSYNAIWGRKYLLLIYKSGVLCGLKTKRGSGGQMVIQTYLNDFKFRLITLL